MYKANGDFIKSRNLYETFTDITTPPMAQSLSMMTPPINTSGIVTIDSNTQSQQMNNIGDVVLTGNGKTVFTGTPYTVNTSSTVADVVATGINTIPQIPYKTQRQKLQDVINGLKNLKPDEVFKNKNNIITMLKSVVDEKIGKISNMNKDDTYKLFRNLISILQETDYMLNDLERVTPRLKNIMRLLSDTSKTIY